MTTREEFVELIYDYARHHAEAAVGRYEDSGARRNRKAIAIMAVFDAQAASIAELKAMLVRIAYDTQPCPICGAWDDVVHKPDCELEALLEGSEE